MAKCVARYVAWLNRKGFPPVTRLMAYLYFVADAQGKAFPTFDTLVKKLGLRDLSYSEVERLLKQEGVVLTKGKNTFGREQDMFQLPDAPQAGRTGTEELRDAGVEGSRNGGSAEQRTSGTAEGASDRRLDSSPDKAADNPPEQAPEKAVQQEDSTASPARVPDRRQLKEPPSDERPGSATQVLKAALMPEELSALDTIWRENKTGNLPGGPDTWFSTVATIDTLIDGRRPEEGDIGLLRASAQRFIAVTSSQPAESSKLADEARSVNESADDRIYREANEALARAQSLRRTRTESGPS